MQPLQCNSLGNPIWEDPGDLKIFDTSDEETDGSKRHVLTISWRGPSEEGISNPDSAHWPDWPKPMSSTAYGTSQGESVEGFPTVDADSICETRRGVEIESISADHVVSRSASPSKKASARRKRARPRELRNIAKEGEPAVLGIDNVPALERLESTCRHISQPSSKIRKEVVDRIRSDLTDLIQDMTAQHGHRRKCKGRGQTNETGRAIAGFIRHNFCGITCGKVKEDHISTKLDAIKSQWYGEAVEPRSKSIRETSTSKEEWGYGRIAMHVSLSFHLCLHRYAGLVIRRFCLKSCHVFHCFSSPQCTVL